MKSNGGSGDNNMIINVFKVQEVNKSRTVGNKLYLT